ncbi:MAG: hypothetical protein IJZ61_06735 [Oscillospiraceae bacterium]|nr:hypothetical protein [Oscillospiraceae bacterium]
MNINKIYCKKILSLICALCMTASLLQDHSVEAVFGSTYGDTSGVNITIDVTDTISKISPYIYGINAESDISSLTVNAIKQTDIRVSSYNWENNFSSSGTGTGSENDVGLISSYPPGRWGDPALYTEYLLTKAIRYNVPSRYVTLQMMGMAASDSEVNRWNEISFNKTDSYLSQPDITDDSVYIDEYVSYLVNRYGYAVDGGINGYFLDNEPENWTERFPSAAAERITADGLIDKSSQLSSAVKRIDPTALIYGPSISGIEAFTNLKNPEDWGNHKREYSWFIDYYLMKMNEASRLAGTRLLDVLDIHYHTEATNGLLDAVIDSDNAFSNNARMQAPRIFWDSTYTENSAIAISHNQHIPLIPTLEASINMYYPGTKLSFSEYNFGGGNHISGGIATADTLGIFAEFGVHMACLKPNTANIDYHKAAINIYTNYDGYGSNFGDTAVEADNGGDIMSSVYSAISGNDITEMKTVLINKNSNNVKMASIQITSDIDYETAEIYFFNGSSSEISRLNEDLTIEDNYVEFEMAPLSVYMLVFKSSSEVLDDTGNGGELIDEPIEEPDDKSDETIVIDLPVTETDNASETDKTSETEISVTSVSSEETTLPPEHVSAETLSSVGTTVNINEIPLPDEPYEASTAAITEPDESAAEETITEKIPSPDDNIKVPKVFKIAVCVLLGGVLIAMLYVVFASGKKNGR